MKYRTLLATLTTAAAVTGLSAGSAGAATSASEQVSSNWAGYVVGGSDSNTQFSNVSGSWVQPTSKCATGQDDAAFWVGIGGDDGQSSSSGSPALGDGSSTSLEQIGTEGNCTGNGTQYYAWYELVPAAPVQLNLAIHPGDHITASVSVNGNSTSFSLTDKTTGQSFSKTVSSPNPDTSSAEWVAEAPSQCDGSGSCTPLPLSDFGTVDFTNASGDRERPHGHDLRLGLDRAADRARLGWQLRRRLRVEPEHGRRDALVVVLGWFVVLGDLAAERRRLLVLTDEWIVRRLWRRRLRRRRLRRRRLSGRLRRRRLRWRRWLGGYGDGGYGYGQGGYGGYGDGGVYVYGWSY